MANKPSYEEFEQRVTELEKESLERQRTEEVLRKSEQRYRNLVEAAMDVIFTLSTDGTIKSLNPAFGTTTGWSCADWLGKSFKGIIHPDDLPFAMELFKQVLQQEKMPIYELRILSKAGEYLIGQFTSTPLMQDGIMTGIIGIARDITEHRRADEALYREKEKFRVLVEESPLGVSITEKDGRYKYINPKFSEIFGYTLEDVPTAQEWLKRAFPDRTYRNRVISSWVGDLKNSKIGECPPQTFIVTCKDGLDKEIHFRPVSLNNGDQIAIYEDITERKQMETQFQEARRLEAVGTLAGGIAHDFNNLLMAIQGNISLMLFDIDHIHPHYQMLRKIEEQVQSGAKLTRQLLGYARKGKYQVKVISLNRLVKETSDTFGRTKKEIKIHRDLAEDLSNVEADQVQIEQVLLNLYINAADAMPGGGDLFLKTINVTHEDMKGKLYHPNPGHYVSLTVTDTGVGMDRKTQGQVFDPFFTTKETGKGTGLGLASAYGIIKAHGGYIDVQSQKGHGTTFSIYLPASEKKVEKVVGSTERMAEGSGTILFVDDEAIVLDVAAKMLEKLGYKVFEARSGKEAVESYETNKDDIDLVILDMIMPEMSGGEAYDKMKRINPNVKVLLSSGYSINGQARKILDRGCDGFIQKPFKMKELSEKIRQVCDGDGKAELFT